MSSCTRDCDAIARVVIEAVEILKTDPPKPLKRQHIPVVVVRENGRVYVENLTFLYRARAKPLVAGEEPGVQVFQPLTKYIPSSQHAMVCDLPQAIGTLLVFHPAHEGLPEALGVPPEGVRPFADISLGLAATLRCKEVPVASRMLVYDTGYHPIVASKYDPIADFSQHDFNYHRDRGLKIASMAIGMLYKSKFRKHKNKVPAITLDDDFNPTETWLVATAGGKSSTATFFTGKPELLNVLKAAWPGEPEETFDSEERYVYMSRFEDLDVLLIAPQPLPAELGAMLGLAYAGEDDEREDDDGIFAVRVRFTCGKRYVGGSRPQLGRTKVSMLFPDGPPIVPPEVLKDVVARGIKRKRAPAKGISRIVDSMNKLSRDTPKLKCVLDLLATLEDLAGDRANDVVEPMTSLDPLTCFQMFSNPLYLRSLAKSCGIAEQVDHLISQFSC